MRTLILALILCASQSQADNLWCIVKMSGGSPMLDTLHYRGYVLAVTDGKYGGYKISGTNAQLTKIAALKDVIPIVILPTTVGAKGELIKADPKTATFDTKMDAKLSEFLSTEKLKPVDSKLDVEKKIITIFEQYFPGFKLEMVDIVE